MRLDKKGMTIVEIIVSVALVSIVLIFLMNLFLKVRAMYEQSKIQADYDILSSNIIKSISNDIDRYGLKSIRYENSTKKNAVIITFDERRPSSLSENIIKVLRISERVESNGTVTNIMSYGYEAIYTNNRTNEERLSNINREIPMEAILNDSELIQLKSTTLSPKDRIIEIKVPLSTPSGNIYDINVYGKTAAVVIEEPELLITNNKYYFTYNATQKMFKSNNQSVNSSTATTTLELASYYGKDISIWWSVDSEDDNDVFEIKKNNATLLGKTSGQNKSGTITNVRLNVGDKLQFTYSKNGSENVNTDTASFRIIYPQDPIEPIETPDTYRVNFDAMGGVTSIYSKNVKTGSTYGTLPTPTRAGYEFIGWFTMSSGGTEIKSSTISTLTSSQILYAHWKVVTTTTKVTLEALGNGFSVGEIQTNCYAFTDANDKFGFLSNHQEDFGVQPLADEACNGTTLSVSKDVIVGGTYGDLPIPSYLATANNLTFIGWFTEISGGTQITKDTVVNNTKNHILYAHWEKR